MDEEEAFPRDAVRLYPCDVCGRRFNQNSLNKHRNACKKLTKSKRKIFDSGRQRADGSDVIYSRTSETRKVQIYGEKAENDVKRPNNWKEKHENFIKSVRQARTVSMAIKTGAPLPKFEPSAPPSDYVKCNFCGRSFSSNAAERHIPFCETQSKRQKINNSANLSSKQKMETRTRYQAPVPGQRKQSSETYGGNGSGSGGGPSSYQTTSGYAAVQNGYSRGVSNGSFNKGYGSGGNDRKPIRYDNTYHEPDIHDLSGGGAYAQKNKILLMNKAKSQSQLQHEQLLRTGRTNANNELNANLARNRAVGSGGYSQKESPMNSRRQVVLQQNGSTRIISQGGVTQTTAAQNTNGTRVNSAKFCHECGSEFPVQWARFCSFCGDRRL